MSKKPKDKDLNKYVTAEKSDNTSGNLNISSHNGSSPSTAGMNGDLDEAPPLYICHTEEEPSIPPADKNKKRINHNATEKNRKDKIRKWINKIGDLLPPVGAATEKPLGRSTLEIVESAWEYITQLKSTNDRLLVEKGDQVHIEEIERLKMDISNMKMERDRYLDMLKSAGVAPSSWCQKNVAVVEPSVEEVVQNGGTVSVLPDGSMEKDQDMKNKKTKRRNTISLRLENMKKQQQQQLQEGQININSQELSAPGIMGNFGGLPMNNVIMGPNGQQIIGNPNMLMNQMMIGGNQMFGQNPAGMMSLPNVGNNQVIGQNHLTQATDKNAEVAGAGLLQLAMQDAGITPNSNNSNSNSNNNNSSNSGPNQNSSGQSAEDISVSANSTVVSTDTSLQSPKSGDQVVSQPSALQTLASVASNTQNISSTSTVSTASTNNNLLSQNSSAATATTQAINTNPIMATGQNGMQFPGGNGMMNMQFQINGQQCFAGNMLQPGAPTLGAPQGQIVFINEQGVPCIANVPLGMDPSMGLQKQIVNNNMLPGQQLPKDLQGNTAMTDQALIANTLAQQQMNMTLQGQLTGMNQQTFQQQQQNAVAMGTGNVMQQAMNNPLAAVGQQFIQPMQGQMQGSAMTQQGIIMPASQVNQSGNLLTVNSVPNQNSQLPQALLLPNGQIIPVVSNPQVFANSSQTSTMPQQVFQQTSGSVQWQQNPGGAARMALPGIQGKVISQGPEGTSSGNNSMHGQVITSNGQLQLGQPHLAMSAQVAQQNQQVALQTGLLMTTNSSLQTSSTTTTSATESQPNIVSSTQSVVVSQADDTVTSASSLSNQFMDSGSANLQNNIFQNAQNITSGMGHLEKQHNQIIQGQGQMVTSQGQGFVSMEGLEANVQGANLNNPLMMPPVFNGPNNTSVNVSSQDNSMTSSVLPSVNTQLTSAINNQMQPGNNPGGAIVLQISCNGQPTSILVDPNTLQVLGTVQTQQQSQQQAQQPTVQTAAPPGSQTSQMSGKKKGKGSQRAIYPKPSSNTNTSNVTSVTVSTALPTTQTGGLWLGTEDTNEQMDIASQQPQPPPPPPPVQNKKSSTKSKSKNKNTKVVSDTASAESHDTSQGSTDILAKAAESIFSTLSPPVGGFYNPANEDNPLQIDTSAGETEEDPEGSTSESASPRKESHLNPTKDTSLGQKKVQKEVNQTNKLEQKQNQSESNKLSVPTPMETVVSTEALTAETDRVIDILTSSTKSVQKHNVGGQMSELAENTLEITPFGGQKKNSAKPNKKQQDLNVEKELLDVGDTSNKKANKKSNKKQKSESTAAEIETVQEKIISPSLPPAQEEEPMMEIMPETITFTEENLSEVLDQVESLGNSLNDSAEGIPAAVITPPSKKSKSRKNKSTASSENEPASKKSKKSNAKDKSGKTKENASVLESPKGSNTAKSSLSVYDFDEDGPDDIQTPMMSLHNSRTSAAQNSAVPVSTSMSMDTPLFGDFPSFTSNKKETPKSKSKSSKSSDKKRTSSGNKSLQEIDSVTKGSGNSDLNIDRTVGNKKSHELFKSHSNKQTEDTGVLQTPPSKQTSSDYVNQQRGNSRNKYDSDRVSSGDFSLTNQNSSSGHRDLSSLNQISPSPSRSNDVASSSSNISSNVMEPVHISTTSDKDDIDNTVNTILGLSATSLSPHIISPRQNQPELSNNTSYQKQVQRSPVLRTPTSVSPVSMTSVSMAHSPPMAQGLQTPKCTSPVPVTTSQSVTKSLPISSVTASDSFNSNTTFSTGTYSTTTEISYSAESLFSSSTSDKPVRPDSLSKNEKMNDRLQTSSKSRSSIYSADNFVQSSKNDSSKFDKGNSQVGIASPLSAGFSRLQNENSSDSFNFSNIGLNVTTPTTSASSIIDSLSMSPVIATLSNNTSSTSSFTFTLSSVTSTVATTSATIPSHQSIHPFPFYQHLHSPQQQVSSSSASLVSNNHISASQSEQPMNMSNFDVDLSRGPQMTQQQSQNPQHSGHDRMPPSHVPSIFSYGMQDSQNNCSLREQPHEQPPFFPNITVTTPSSVNKTQNDQIRNTHKQTHNMQELNMGRNISNKPHIVEPPISSAADRNLQISHSSEHRNNVGLERSMQLPPNSESRSSGGRLDQPLQLSRSSESRTNNVIECPVQMSGNSDNRNSSGHDRPMQLTSNSEKRNTSGHERTNQMQHKTEQRPGSGHMDRTNQVQSSESRSNSSMDRPIQHGHNSDNRSSSGGLERQSQLSNSSDNRTDSRMSADRHPHMNSLQSFFPGSNFPNTSSHSLNTPPLHHLPLLSQQDERSNINRGGSYESVFPHHSQGFNAVSQNFHGNRYEHGNVPFQQREMSGSHRLSHTPPNSDGRKSANPPSHSTKSNKQSRQQQQVQPQQQQPPPMNVPPPSRSTGPTPPHQPPLQRATPPQATPPQQNPSSQQSRQSKSSASRSKQSQKKNKPQYVDMDTNYPPAMFDTNRSLTPFFGLPPQNLSPPSRNIQNDGPLFPGNFFGASSRPLSNSSSVPKNAEISTPFNSLFPPSRPPQNGLGLNFQHGFGMNPGGMSSGTQITPHSNSVTVTPHMSNFSLTNIFSEVGNSQNDSMNMSPIKFPHSNPILPPQGMDPNSLQHPHHQSSSLYHHNRGPHPPPPVIHTAMSINSILGHNHHGFDTRPMPRAMNTSAPPFGGHGHPPPTFGMPPLDFSMHEH